MNSKIEAKLKKLLALINRGVDGEKENAEKLLHLLLEKHGISLESILDSDDKESFFAEFRYRTAHEKTIIFQTAAKVINNYDGSYFPGRKGIKKVAFELTASDNAMMKLHLSVYLDDWRKYFKERQEILINAFIQKNRIFSPKPSKSQHEEMTGADRKRMQQILDASEGIKASNILNQIEE